MARSHTVTVGSRASISVLCRARASVEGRGKFAIFELDTELRNTQPLLNGNVVSFAPQFGLANVGWSPRWWEVDAAELGLSVRTDLEWSTSAAGPWSSTLGFNPSFNSDFQTHNGVQRLQLRCQAMLFYRAYSQWMYVVGVGYLDRVHNYVLPYSGVVWTPNDRTELRLMFPESPGLALSRQLFQR